MGKDEIADDEIANSNDDINPTQRGLLVAQVNGAAGVSNVNFGYVAGGHSGSGFVNQISRLDFGNDTATSVDKCNVSSSRQRMGATANKSYGYFAGGGDPSVESTVDRLDFSSDTTNTATTWLFHLL